MKKLLSIIVLVLIAVLFTNSKSTKPTTVVDDVLLISRAATPPIIDGSLDKVWYNINNTLMSVLEESTEVPTNWLDAFSTFRVLWNDDSLYLFVSVYDDEIVVPDSVDPWNKDNIQIFIDGLNAKGEGGDNWSYVNWRYVYGQKPGGHGAEAGATNFAFLKTRYGWNLEIAISQDDLPFELTEDILIGWEIQLTDIDSTNSHYLRWWSSGNTVWNRPEIWGEAQLKDYEYSDYMTIHLVDYQIAVDGYKDDFWEEIPEYPFNFYLDGTDISTISGPEDLWCSYRTIWDRDYFYLFAEIRDDQKYFTDDPYPWTKDHVQIFIKPDTLCKQPPWYENELYFYWYARDTSPADSARITEFVGDFAFMDTKTGWNFELAIPIDFFQELGIEEGRVFGWEIIVGDSDSLDFTATKWWSSKYTDIEPCTVGPAIFGGIGPCNNITSRNKRFPLTFKLDQNYPNPFNPNTTISYQLTKEGSVELVIFNVNGEIVRTLVDKNQPPGTYNINWDGKNEAGLQVGSGVYITRLKTDNISVSNKMILIH